MSIVKSIKARDLKVHTISAADLATLEANLQAWLDGRTEEVVISVEFETAAASDNRVYILYTE